MARDPESGTRSRPRLVDQVATLITAGHETTGVALFWSSLARRCGAGYPGAASPRKSRHSISGRRVRPRSCQGSSIRARSCTRRCASIRRPSPSCGKQAVPTTPVAFRYLPARSCSSHPGCLHRHRRLWPQPEVFDPARFLPGAPAPDRFAYLPFGIGPRVCIGAQFALTEATLVLATMVKAFHIERADAEPVDAGRDRHDPARPPAAFPAAAKALASAPRCAPRYDSFLAQRNAASLSGRRRGRSTCARND